MGHLGHLVIVGLDQVLRPLSLLTQVLDELLLLEAVLLQLLKSLGSVVLHGHGVQRLMERTVFSVLIHSLFQQFVHRVTVGLQSGERLVLLQLLGLLNLKLVILLLKVAGKLRMVLHRW